MDLKYKIPVAVLAVFCGLSVPLAMGKSKFRGGNVFDPTRLAKQVELVNQQIKNLQAQIEKLDLLKLAQQDANEAAREMQQREKHDTSDFGVLQGSSSVNPNVHLEDDKDLNGKHDTWKVIQEMDDFSQKLLKKVSAANADALRYTAVLTLNTEQRNKALEEILGRDNDKDQKGGNLSEQQKTNMIGVTNARNTVDSAQAQIAEAQAEAVKIQQENTSEALKLLSSGSMTMKPYDPYHPDETDKRYLESHPKEEPFGFLRFHDE